MRKAGTRLTGNSSIEVRQTLIMSSFTPSTTSDGVGEGLGMKLDDVI